jgi:Na+/H+ antiporter NhaC
MKIPKGFLFALIIIFSAAFVIVGFSQEDKKESAPQKKTTVDQKPSEKDLKPQEEKKPEEKKSTPSEEAQQRYP